ncbi:hypothetical protein BDV98DRAFT_563958 [Pterulicium gracile]|uniref:Uncharacterized protein n=1 Tax=Pterulicium gracile TaxID=1884261 RepID=A0A5C3QPI3_9AGAR|nr:hypothetical protein BDV98DRAFT_563958 [Pterula gracilis]
MQPLYKSFYALIPLALLSIHLSGSFVSSAPAPAPGPFQHEATVVDLVGRNTTVPPPETYALKFLREYTTKITICPIQKRGI